MARALAPIAAAVAAAVTLAVAAVPARGQGLPFDVRATQIATAAPIEDYVNKAVTEMASGDRDRVMSGRNLLLAPLARDPSQKSQTFLTTYARTLAGSLGPVVAGKDPHAKLNAALVLIRAGEQSRSPALSPIIAQLIGDESPAVASYGERAAGTILVYALANLATAKDDPMVPAIVKAVAENPESDAIPFEAYQALAAVARSELAQLAGPQVVQAATPPTIDALHQLMDVRLKQYAAGDIVEPASEASGITLLTQQAWAASTPEQQTRTVQLMAGLLDAAATQLNAAVAGGAVQNRARAESLRTAIKAAASGLNVVGQKANLKPLIEASSPFKNYGVATPAADLRAAADKAVAEAKKAYPETVGGAATAPASAAP